MAVPPNAPTSTHEYGDPPPHPLVCGLAVGVQAGGTLEQARQAVDISLSLNAPTGGSSAGAGAGGPPDLDAALKSFPLPGRAHVVMFAGYLGPRVDRNGKHWRFLYQDAKATSWLLMPESSIVLHHRADDRKAAFGLRDIIWVKADTPVRQGEEAESAEARFLVGGFTSAGDLHASLTGGGGFAADSGVLCAPTPECCRAGTHCTR